jgi:DTW domain-containing protein YfiP
VLDESAVPLASHRCPRCRFPAPGCLCPAVPRVRTRVEVVFLRHASERDRLSNTGHWASLALEGSAVLEQGAPGAPLDGSLLAAPGTWVLFPSPHPPAGGARPARLVVPDGTWPQARRMLQRVPALRALPRLALPAAAPALRLRRPAAGGMSTLEALAAALRRLGEPDAADRLEALLAAGVGLASRLRGYPDLREGYPAAVTPRGH